MCCVTDLNYRLIQDKTKDTDCDEKNVLSFPLIFLTLLTGEMVLSVGPNRGILMLFVFVYVFSVWLL